MSDITDTERMNWIAEKLCLIHGSDPITFRGDIDRQILSTRATGLQWIDLTVEFPHDDVPIYVMASNGRRGRVCYNSITGDWTMHAPTSGIHGRFWSEVHGTGSEIVKWRAVQ